MAAMMDTDEDAELAMLGSEEDDEQQEADAGTRGHGPEVVSRE